MAKKVKLLSGLIFPSLTAAKAHFDNLRKVTKPGAPIPEPERSDVLDVYGRYCVATGFEAVTAVDVTTENDNQKRPFGGYATTRAFAVVTASGSTRIFSYEHGLESDCHINVAISQQAERPPLS